LRARTATAYMQIRRLRTDGPGVHWQRLERMLEWDRACAVLLNSTLSASYERVWVAVDRLGDCGPWCAFIVALALFGGPAGARCALHMLAAGMLALVLYKIVKTCAGRPRPCVRMQTVRRCVEPLDEFSFPSGHTLHAVAFSVVALAYFPVLAVVLMPFIVLTAISRIALGLHYPSDVFAGAAIGAGVGLVALRLF
jgi:undecaprenyl-diphosphatase